MCLIIFTPNIRYLKTRRSVLERGFYRNSDGAGVAYLKDGQLVVSKVLTLFDDFMRVYDRVVKTTQRGPLLVHFRNRTCGPMNEVNTQPLVVNSGELVMAHNGVFSGLSNHESEVSDSVELARLVRRMEWTLPFTAAQTDMFRALCDSSSKLVFIDHEGRSAIINEQLGCWRAGSWYSDRGRVFSADKPFYTSDEDAPWRAPNRDQSYREGYHHDYDDPEEALFAAHLARELDDRARETTSTAVGQTGLLKRPQVREGVPYEKMTKLEKAAFEAHREQERIRSAHERKRKSQPSTHPTYAHPWHNRSMVDPSDAEIMSRFNQLGD